ncbi:hypothetical protein ACH4S8_44885 [Streptomyces sp. NPDC021080]|uniref:hypothetical protein n=1 Tax=Streptomyces sp. NPDC021080 TaxID=3365110 RepID=UPI0037AE319A
MGSVGEPPLEHRAGGEGLEVLLVIVPISSISPGRWPGVGKVAGGIRATVPVPADRVRKPDSRDTADDRLKRHRTMATRYDGTMRPGTPSTGWRTDVPDAELKEKYQRQLVTLKEMGYPNELHNLEALKKSDGNLGDAVNLLAFEQSS